MSTLETGATEGLYSVPDLIEKARISAGVDDASVLNTPGLMALTHGLQSASEELSFIGRRRAQRLLLETLVKRLRVEKHFNERPEIRDIEISSPIFLIAPARTGTTFLHRLLAQDPAHRTVRLWEALQAPPAEADYQGDPDAYFEKDYRVEIARHYIETRARYTPEIASIHPTDVNAPEECFGLLETSMLSHSFTFYGPVTEYLDWLDQRSDDEWKQAYSLYADQLRLLQWWAPGERWVLKTPFHMWAIDAISEIFPDALFVQQHREPAVCVASYCSLTENAYGPIAAREVDRDRIGKITMDYLRQALPRVVAARNKLDPSRFIDVDYKDLVSDPIGTVRKVYEAAGTPLSETSEKHIVDWYEDQAKHRKKSAKHRYSLEDYGLDPDEVNDIFSEYSAFNQKPGR